MELSELLPHIGSCADDIALIRSMHHEAFDHAPGELMTCTGKDMPGRPSIGSWLTYGLGSESQNLPGYVVLLNGRSPKARETGLGQRLPAGDAPGRAVPHGRLADPEPGQPAATSRRACTAPSSTPSASSTACSRSGRTTRRVAARIAAYELAFRMQSAAPELIDLTRRDAAHARTPTATAPSPAACCWRGGWSSAACASSPSRTTSGTTTTTSATSCRGPASRSTSRSPPC